METSYFNDVPYIILKENEDLIHVFINRSNLPDKNILMSLAMEINARKATSKDVMFASRPKDKNLNDKTINLARIAEIITIKAEKFND